VSRHCLLAAAILGSSLSLATAAHAESAEETDADPPRIVLGAGAATGRFVGLPYRALLLDIGARLPRRYVRWTSDAELEIGQTERGLSLYRGGVDAGIENAGRVRIGIGARLSYAMVLRATRSDPFASALVGDIGGFGLGAQACFSVDIVRTKAWVLGLAARASGDVYNGGTAARLGGLVDASF